MAEVKWIKITTDIFDDEKILMIESLPSADSIIVIWFKLLALAGKQNNNGVFIMSNGIPYTDEMLASIFRRDINTVRMAVEVFRQYGMVEIIYDTITIPNWEKHQTLDSYEKKKQRDKLYQQERRRKQKMIASGESSDESSDVAVSEEEIEEDKERNIYTSKNCQKIIDLYNDICKSLPRCIKLSETRKRHIKARLKDGYGEDDFRKIFEKAEASDFLTGKAEKWKASFDWLVNENNMIKVLEGNYDNKGQSTHFTNIDF